MKFNNLSFKSETVKASQPFFKEHKNSILATLNCEENDILFYFFENGLTKKNGYFFLKNEYVKASFNKKNGTLKEKGIISYAEVKLRPVKDAISHGLGYIFVNNDNSKTFKVFYKFFSKNELEKDVIINYIAALKQVVANSKNTQVQIPEANDLLSGRTTVQKAISVKVKASDYDKNLAFIEKNKENFLQLLKLSSTDDIMSISKLNLGLTITFDVFLKDRFVFVETNSSFSKERNWVEFLYKDVDDISVGKKSDFNIVPFSLILSIKANGQHLIDIETNMLPLLKQETQDEVAKKDYEFFKQILKNIVQQSNIKLDEYYEKLAQNINSWKNYYTKQSLDNLMEKMIVDLLIFTIASQSFDKNKNEALFDAIDEQYLYLLEQMKLYSEQDNMECLFVSAYNIPNVAVMKRILQQQLNEKLENVAEINIEFVEPLLKKIDKTDTSLSSANAYNSSTSGDLGSMLVGSIYKGIKKSNLTSFVKKWSENELENEISRIKKNS